jgi:hypothetical protein
MANNRMAIVCKKCNLGTSIAKFYPQGGYIAGNSSGWGQFTRGNDRVEYFFVVHAHEFDQSMWGGNQYELRYEIDDNTWQYDELEGFEAWNNQPIPTFSEGALEPAEKITKFEILSFGENDDQSILKLETNDSFEENIKLRQS